MTSSSFPPTHKMLRKGILTGVGISVFILVSSILRYPVILKSPAAARFLPLFLASVVLYALAAIRWTRVTNSEDFVVLHYGARWGVVIGLAWIVEVFAGNVLMPQSPAGLLATLVAALLPVVAGAAGAAVTGQAWTGARIGFWSGVVSGLIAFVGVAGIGYLVANSPEFLQDQQVSSNIGNAIGDYLAVGVSHLVLVGALFCSAAGALGGMLGRVFRSSRAIRLNY